MSTLFNCLLNSVTANGDWQAWLLYILKATEEVAHWTCRKIAAIRNLMDSASVYIRSELPKIYSYELVQVIFEQPYCRIQYLVDSGVTKRQTASVYLKQLADIGMLDERQAGREKLFVNPRLMYLMTEDSNTPNLLANTELPSQESHLLKPQIHNPMNSNDIVQKQDIPDISSFAVFVFSTVCSVTAHRPAFYHW